jgi:hypothetical protein
VTTGKVLVGMLADGEADGVGVDTDVVAHETRVIASSTHPTRLVLDDGRRLNTVPVFVAACAPADLRNLTSSPVLQRRCQSVGYSAYCYRATPWGGRAASRYPAACSSGIKMATAATVWLRVSPPPS